MSENILTPEVATKKDLNQKKKKLKKPTGPIRWTGLFIFFLLFSLSYAYFFFFFDSHLRSFIEWSGYKALGVEINIDQFKSSFLKGNVKIDRVQITDSETPQFNAIEISEIRFDLNIDALLRLKFVIEDMGADGIQFMSKRSRPGKVAPPEPVDPNEPSLVDQLQGKALNKLEDKYENNVLGDIASFLKSGGDGTSQLKNIEDSLKSKKLAEEMKTKWEQKKTSWDLRLKELPNDKDFSGFKSRFESIKYKDFSTPQELQGSVDQFNTLKSDVDGKIKFVDQTKNDFLTDLKLIQTDSQLIEQAVKNDISSLKDRMKIPKIDAGNMAKSLFMEYLTPYLAKLDKYKAMAKKYLPPKFANMLEKDSREKQKKALEEEKLIPHARAKGTTYEFPKRGGYPMFWIKNITISSKSNRNSDYGDIDGKITDVTSNQRQIAKTTKLKVKGDFKSKKLLDLFLDADLNNLKEVPVVTFQFGYGSLPLENINLITSTDGSIALPLAKTSLKMAGETIGFKKVQVDFNFNFSDAKFLSSAKDKIVSEILEKTLSQINQFDMKGGLSGELPKPNIALNSSLGAQLEQAFQRLLQEKIDEATKKVKDQIEKEIAKYKGEFEKIKNDFQKQIDSQVNSAQSQLTSQKKLAETRVEEAKKDLENQGKKKLEAEGQKAIDDLKKKLGF